MRLIPVAAAAALVLASTSPAQAATSVARWEMGEPVGARTMLDSSGNGLKGSVGNDVYTGLGFSGGGGYRFASVSPDDKPVRPEHTVVVPDDSRLDPGWRDYTVELRVRTSGQGGNIIQKGQARTAGGFWKIELNAGEPTCMFRGPDGTTNAVRARGGSISYTGWHTVQCTRTPNSVDLWVDGRHVGRNTGQTGSIANSQPVSIGGKQNCDQQQVGCDYFGGDVDWIRITAS